MPQDLPPSGGYEPVQYKRNLPARGFRPSYYLAAMAAIMTYGFYKAGKGIREQKYESSVSSTQNRYSLISQQLFVTSTTFLKVLDAGRKSPMKETFKAKELIFKWFSELAREKMWSRIHLIPLLTAEEDRDLVRRHWADIAREKELLGSETKVYHGTRFVRPTYSITPGYITK